MDDYVGKIPELREGKICGVYVVHHLETEKFYVGSTTNLYNRSKMHESSLRLGKHKNTNLQEAYNSSSEVIISCVPTTTIEEARKIEQDIIDDHRETGVLFNISIDVDAPRRGLECSEEHAEKLRLANTGKARSPEVLRRMQENHPLTVSISINGQIYPSIGAAVRDLGLTYDAVKWRIDSHAEKYRGWSRVD